MTKTIDTLVEDIYALFNQDGERRQDRDIFEQFGRDLSTVVNARLDPRERERTLRLSNIGRPDRQVWMDIRSEGPKEELRPETLIKFLYGDMIEQMILLFAELAGHTVTHKQVEVDIGGVKGHPDCLIDGVVVDIKSASQFAFVKFEKGTLLEEGNDPFGYVAQLAGYVAALTPGAEGAFLAVDKTLGKLTLLRVPADVLEAYNVEKRVEHMKEVVQQPEPPPHCYVPVPEGKSGNMKLALGCSYCQHKFNCWPKARAFAYSSGPVFLTHVELEPRVPEIAIDQR